jgi:iron complex transport system substrate-binding protein
MRRALALGLVAAMCLIAGASAGEAAVRSVSDGVGRRVELPDTPRRIVTLTPSLAEIVYGIGAGDAIAAVTDHTDYPSAARAKPSVGGMVDPSVERIVALRPDLVLATLESNRQTTIDGLQRLGIPVFVIRPEGLDGILQAVEQVGLALNRISDARAAVERLRVRRQDVADRVAGLAKPRVFVLIWPDPVVTVGRHAFITEAIEAAGAECVTSNLPQPWPRLSLEEVVRLAPDTIVLIANGHPTLSLDELNTRPGWNRVPAVIAHRFVEIDARLEHSSPAVFDALEELARVLHPEAFHKP